MDQMCSDTIKLYYLDSIYMNIGTYMSAKDFFRGRIFEECGSPG